MFGYNIERFDGRMLAMSDNFYMNGEDEVVPFGIAEMTASIQATLDMPRRGPSPLTHLFELDRQLKEFQRLTLNHMHLRGIGEDTGLRWTPAENVRGVTVEHEPDRGDGISRGKIVIKAAME